MRLFKKTKPKKLNTTGMSHHLLVAILVVSTIAGVGAWRVWSSSAATLNNSLEKRVATQDGCELAGRIWDTKKKDCLAKCRANTGAYRTIKGSDGNIRGFCTESVAESMNTLAEAKRCTQDLHRFYIREIGCARRASQENANNARQCIGHNSTDPKAYKNYVAEGNVDRCVQAVIAQTGDNTGAKGTQVATDPLSKSICQALGRRYDTTKNACQRDCRADTGTLLVHSNKTQYCSKAVATTITQARCNDLHRKWTPAGCARRADQKDNANDTISCVVGYPYYNSNSEASASGRLDVCEKNAATAASNEKANIIGVNSDGTPRCKEGTILSSDKKSCVKSPTGPATNGSAAGAGPVAVVANSGLPTEGKYRIVLYKDKNFKGDKLSVTATLKDNDLVYKVAINDKELSPQPSDLASLPKGWDNKVSSYKVLQGRWQVCPEKDYKAGKTLQCSRPWASNPDLNDTKNKAHKLDNQLSSVRPVVKVTYEDPEQITESGSEAAQDTIGDAEPLCATAAGVSVPRSSDGVCPADAKFTCPEGLELRDGECKEKIVAANVIVPVDTSFKGKVGQEHCELIGREWIGKPGAGKQTNGGEYGCSLVTCNREADGAPRQSKDGPVCINYQFDAAYAVPLSKKTCGDLHRVYISQVKRCAQVPNRKDKNQTVVNARQCRDKGHTVYYIFKANSKNDECFNPNYFQRARGVAKSVRGNVSNALKQGPRAYCATVKRGAYHWNGQRCVIDRKGCWDGSVALGNAKCPPDNRTSCQKYGGSYCTSPDNSTPPNITPQSMTSRYKACQAAGHGTEFKFDWKTGKCTLISNDNGPICINNYCYDPNNPLGLDFTKIGPAPIEWPAPR